LTATNTCQASIASSQKQVEGSGLGTIVILRDHADDVIVQISLFHGALWDWLRTLVEAKTNNHGSQMSPKGRGRTTINSEHGKDSFWHIPAIVGRIVDGDSPP
jgi:hypothetical protein